MYLTKELQLINRVQARLGRRAQRIDQVGNGRKGQRPRNAQQRSRHLQLLLVLELMTMKDEHADNLTDAFVVANVVANLLLIGSIKGALDIDQEFNGIVQC